MESGVVMGLKAGVEEDEDKGDDGCQHEQANSARRRHDGQEVLLGRRSKALSRVGGREGLDLVGSR